MATKTVRRFAVSPREILTAVQLATGATMSGLRGPNRSPHLARARWVAVHLLTRLGLSSVAVGDLLNRDHTTILYGRAKAEALAESDPMFQALLERVEQWVEEDRHA
jgi:chromosomal replication initiation ATPase DnaA